MVESPLPLPGQPADAADTSAAHDEPPRGPDAPQPEDAKLLNGVLEQLVSDQVRSGLEELFLTLNARRRHASPAEWKAVVEFCLRHPLRAAVHQDPFTRHAFDKPRGYPGDAVLLDYIYGHDEGRPLPPETTELGRAIHQYVIATPACEGVRARREFVAHLLDELASSAGKIHALSLAAGHLREADLAASVKRRRLGRFVALDADTQSLAEVQRAYGRYGVEPVVSSVRQLLAPNNTLGQFDLIYSTGLFDYLRQGTAQRLALALFRMLRPRGRLVLANFLPGIPDQGYMESFMAWHLIYRTRAEMLDVAARIPQPEVRDIHLFAEENQNIIFLQVTRA